MDVVRDLWLSSACAVQAWHECRDQSLLELNPAQANRHGGDGTARQEVTDWLLGLGYELVAARDQRKAQYVGADMPAERREVRVRSAMGADPLREVAALAENAGPYVLDPTDYVSVHRAIEVFPPPTWIEVFGLHDRVAYKKGPRVARIAALATLHDLLGGVASDDLPLRACADRISELLPQAATARRWKAVEGITDARPAPTSRNSGAGRPTEPGSSRAGDRGRTATWSCR